MSEIQKKICLLGDFSVGKTSLIRRFVEGKFSDAYLTTMGAKVSRRVVKLDETKDIKQVKLLIWDLEGNTKFKPITPSYLKGASGSIIVADLTRISTLNNLEEHINLFHQINPQQPVVIAFNKADLVDQEKLNKLLEIYTFKQYSQITKIYPTSAKTGEFVPHLFQQLTIAMLKF